MCNVLTLRMIVMQGFLLQSVSHVIIYFINSWDKRSPLPEWCGYPTSRTQGGIHSVWNCSILRRIVSYNLLINVVSISLWSCVCDYTVLFCSFNSVKNGNHVMFREFNYIKATQHNRASFLRIFWRCYRQLGKNGGQCEMCVCVSVPRITNSLSKCVASSFLTTAFLLMTDLLAAMEYSSLLQLLCPDFPSEMVQNAARLGSSVCYDSVHYRQILDFACHGLHDITTKLISK